MTLKVDLDLKWTMKLKNEDKWSYWQDLRGSDWDGTQTLKLKTSNKLLLLLSLSSDMVAQWTCG